MCLLFLLAIQFCIPSFTWSADQPALVDPNFIPLSTRNGLSQDIVNDIVIDNAGFVWIATEGGLNRWDGYRVDHIEGPDNVFTNASIFKLGKQGERYLWIGTYGSGVYRYDLQENKIELMINRPHREQPDWTQLANNFFPMQNGHMLVALYEDVVEYDPQTGESNVLYSVSDEEMDRNESVRYAIVIDDVLLVATSHQLRAVDLREPNATAVSIDYLNDTARNADNINAKYLLVDSQQRLWVGTVEGLFMAPASTISALVRHQGAATPFKQVVEYRNIWRITEANANEFWLGSDNGLNRLTLDENSQWQTDYILEPHNGRTQLSKKDIHAVAIDKDHNLWLGTVYGGALYWSPRSLDITYILNNRFDKQPLLSNSTIWSFHQSDDDTLWIGTDNGLNRYSLSTETSTQFLVTEGSKAARAESTIERIFAGPDSTLLLQTYDGIRQFDMTTGQTRIPDTIDPKDQDVFKRWNAGGALDQQGRLYFFSDHFYRYDPVAKTVIKLPLPEDPFDAYFTAGFIGSSPYYDGRLFLSLFGSLWLIDPDTFEYELVYDFPPEQKNNAISITSWVVDSNNTLWLSFPRFGMIALDATTFAFKTRFSESNLLMSNIVYALKKDQQGGIWFSSHSGLHRYSPMTKTLRNFLYGQELIVSEFNEGAAIKLRDGRLAYGSTNGVVLFDPVKLLGTSQPESRFTQEMVISDVELDSRKLPVSRQNLSGQHFNLLYDDYGLTIHFSPMVMSVASDASFHYTLRRGDTVVTEATTRDANVTFASLLPGEYQFEVTMASVNYDFTILPAHMSFTKPYPPLRSPLAYSVYAILVLAMLLTYFYKRQRQLTRLHTAQKQVRLFGDAFKQTRDWVIIFNADKEPVAANPAFSNTFGFLEKERLDKQLRRLYQRFPKLKRQLSGRLGKLQAGDFFKDEDSIEGPDGRIYDVLIDITAISDKYTGNRIDHYLLVISDISEQKSAERKLLKIANYDSLTGLVNRSLLLDRLEHAIANAARHHTKVAILFVDLDRFKGINDSLGHDYGDKLLRVVANRMRNLASANDTVARLGGDEFVIVMEEVESPVSLSSFVGQLIESVETPISLAKEVLRVSCSVGVSFYPDDAQDAAELLKQADVAMYTAKKDPLNGFTYFTTEMNERAKHRLHLENLVKKAYTEDAFYNHYQPVVDTQSGKVEGLELLLRCRLQDQPIGPDVFIPILEQLRYIIEVTRQAMHRVVVDLSLWYQQGFNGYVSINLSALHFKTEFDMASVAELLEAHNLPHSAIRFEITEGVLMDDTDNTLRQINQFVEAGFILALDDFGTGYSSLSYLKRYPLEVLKIDKSFVDELQPGNENDALVVTTIDLASRLNMECVAEGVETLAQAQYLSKLGCHYQQGYYFSRPVEASDVSALLATHWTIE